MNFLHLGKSSCAQTLAYSTNMIADDLHHSQIRIHSRHFGFLYRVRYGFKPAFRFPFCRILAPNCFVPVARSNPNDDHSVFGDDDLMNHRSVFTLDRLRERQNNIFPGPGGVWKASVTSTWRNKYYTTHSRDTKGTGG